MDICELAHECRQECGHKEPHDINSPGMYEADIDACNNDRGCRHHTVCISVKSERGKKVLKKLAQG